MRIKKQEFIHIAGPCAAESLEQVLTSAREAQKLGITYLRVSLAKPRTRPGFGGVLGKGIPWLLEVSRMGLVPATEVLLPEQATALRKGIIDVDPKSRLFVWLGARNQNHFIQQQIGKVVAGHPRISIMVKNQPWPDKQHWKGIVYHLLHAGVHINQILLCHRGFAPSTALQRNPPDFLLAMEVKNELEKELHTSIPMIADPSHAAGYSAQNVLAMARQMLGFRHIINDQMLAFNGLMVEVHPDPRHALTDSNQQLTWAQYKTLLNK